MSNPHEESPAERQELVNDVLTGVTQRSQDELVRMLSADSGPLVRFGLVEADHLRKINADPGRALLLGIAIGRVGLEQVEHVEAENQTFNPDTELQSIVSDTGTDSTHHAA